MKNISFLRHAKSDWAMPFTSDHDRCLNDRGKKASKSMREFFLKTNHQFDIVFSSTAMRAIETVELIRPALRKAGVKFDKALYTFDDHVLIDIISQISDEYSAVLIVGHSPAIQETALRLSSTKSDNKFIQRIQNKYPTGAFCSLCADISSWSHVGDTLFNLVEFVCPKDL